MKVRWWCSANEMQVSSIDRSAEGEGAKSAMSSGDTWLNYQVVFQLWGPECIQARSVTLLQLVVKSLHLSFHPAPVASVSLSTEFQLECTNKHANCINRSTISVQL